MNPTIEDLGREVERLRGIVAELADELEAELIGHYGTPEDQHPTMHRRFDRDMEIVVAARTELEVTP